MSSRASLPLPPTARVPLLPLSPVAPSRFHPGASLSLPDSSPSSHVIHLALVQNSGCPSRSDSRYPPYFSLPPQRLVRLYPFVYLSPSRVEVVYCYLFPVHCHEAPLLFSAHLSFLKQPCQQLSSFLFRFSFSSILDTPRHASPSLIHPLYFSISSCFLTHIRPSIFPTLLPSFHVSRFPSLLRCPSGRSTLFSDSHQPFLDAALPTKVRGALFPIPARVQPEVLACAARPSIYFSSPTLLPGRVYTCCRFHPARVRVRSHYT